MSHPLERTTSNSSVATVTGASERESAGPNTKTLRYQNVNNPQQAREYPHAQRNGRDFPAQNGPGPGRAGTGEHAAGYPPVGHSFTGGQGQGLVTQQGPQQGQAGNGKQQQQQQQQGPAALQQNQSQNQNQSQSQNQLPWGSPFPSLHLWPLNETFVMKMIHLPPGERIKIGRQTNAKTQPGERNGYFDSKVLSRMHAEIWEHEGKMYIKDVKSSNGTFVNGDRLSAEGAESEPFELKSEDMVEFGIDIISEDNKTIVHHKVSAKAYCVFDVDDAGLSARELTQYYPHDPRTSMGPQRRNGNQGPLQPGVAPGGQPLAMNMMSAGGKAAGLNFDHVLHRLQTELLKSKETGSELQGLTSAMTEIQDTLSGNLPPNENGSANQFIPPQFRPLPDNGIPDAAMGNTSATIAALQAQLSSTQSILVSHKDRIRSLETLLSEQEAIKDEVLGIRQQLEESKREYEGLLKESREYANGRKEEEEKIESPRPREPLERNSWKESEPDAGIEYEGDITDGIMDDFEDARSTSSDSKRAKGSPIADSDSSASLRQEELMAQNNALSVRLDALSSELEHALELSRSLQSQHAEAKSTVKVLEERVQSLEKDMARRVTEVSTAGKAAEDKWEAWKNRFEEGWRKEKEGWELERERLRGVVREWEEASRRAQEEEEERLMNSRIEDAIVDSDEGDTGSASDRSRGSRRVSGSRSWPETTSGADSGAVDSDEDEDDDAPRSPRKVSHSASPSMSRPDAPPRSRRESSSRLDPAIRALRATAGDLPEQRKSGRGSRTPRTGSPSMADGALDSLRVKANRPKRADTIKGRKRNQTPGSDNTKAISTGTSKTDKPTTPPDKPKTEGPVVTRDDEKGSDENNTSTESDETAHGRSRDDENVDDDTATISARPAEVKGMMPINYHATIAVSVVIVAIVGYACFNKMKET